MNGICERVPSIGKILFFPVSPATKKCLPVAALRLAGAGRRFNL